MPCVNISFVLFDACTFAIEAKNQAPSYSTLNLCQVYLFGANIYCIVDLSIIPVYQHTPYFRSPIKINKMSLGVTCACACVLKATQTPLGWNGKVSEVERREKSMKYDCISRIYK